MMKIKKFIKNVLEGIYDLTLSGCLFFVYLFCLTIGVLVYTKVYLSLGLIITLYMYLSYRDFFISKVIRKYHFEIKHSFKEAQLGEKESFDKILNSDHSSPIKLFQLIIKLRSSRNQKERLTGRKMANYMGISVRHFRRILKTAVSTDAVSKKKTEGRNYKYEIHFSFPRSSLVPDPKEKSAVYLKSYFLFGKIILVFIALTALRITQELYDILDKKRLHESDLLIESFIEKHYRSSLSIAEIEVSDIKLDYVNQEFQEPLSRIGLCKDVNQDSDDHISQKKKTAMDKIIEADLNPREKLLQISLLLKDRENRQGNLTGKRLAGLVGCRERTIRRIIKSDMIKIIRGNGRTNRYKIPGLLGNTNNNDIWTLKDDSNKSFINI